MPNRKKASDKSIKKKDDHNADYANRDEIYTQKDAEDAGPDEMVPLRKIHHGEKKSKVDVSGYEEDDTEDDFEELPSELDELKEDQSPNDAENRYDARTDYYDHLYDE